MDARVVDSLGIPDPLRMEALLRELMRGVNAMILRDMGQAVLVGPFKGMVIPSAEEEAWCDGNFSSKLLGTYEHELHDVIAHAVARNPASLLRALEHLAADPQVPARVTAATAPLWVEAPGTEFTDRIARLRRAAGLPVE